MKIQLEGTAETLLIPLWARAYESQKAGAHLVEDPLAVQLMKDIDYDFTKFAQAKMSQIGTAVRTCIFDREVNTFLKLHPAAICINLGCGLDTRFYRIDNGMIDWYELDLPEVIELRQTLLPATTRRYHLLGASVFDPTWPRQIEMGCRPVLILMEGVSMYFSEKQMKQLFSLLVQFFPSAVCLLEVMPPFLIRNQKYHDSVTKTNAHFIWGVNDGCKLEKLNSHVHFCRQWTLYEGFRRCWGIMGVLSLIPWWNKNCNDKVVSLAIRG